VHERERDGELRQRAAQILSQPDELPDDVEIALILRPVRIEAGRVVAGASGGQVDRGTAADAPGQQAPAEGAPGPSTSVLPSDPNIIVPRQ
jgi:hypothetical protein